MHVAILAGGLGTRMRPLTEKVPKALLPVGDRQFVDLQLTFLRSQGVRKVTFLIGHKGEMLQAHVGDGSRWDLRANYSDEGEHLLGTGGALKLACDRGLLPERFLLLYGDSFLPTDFRAVWRHFETCDKPALMTVFENRGRFDAVNIEMRDGQLALYQKRAPADVASRMKHIDYGLSAFRREVVADYPSGQGAWDLSALQHRLSVDGRLEGFEVLERFYEIGSPEGLRDLEEWLGRSPRGLILLDRDGVLNRMRVDPEHGIVDSPMTAEQVEIAKGATEAVSKLLSAGYELAICTNQPAAAKGKTTYDHLRATHARVLEAVTGGHPTRIATNHICLHRSEDHCDCRKPKPAMLESAILAYRKRHGGRPPIDLWMVGDGITDIQAGEAVGARTAFVGALKPDVLNAFAALGGAGAPLRPTRFVKDLAAFAADLLETR